MKKWLSPVCYRYFWAAALCLFFTGVTAAQSPAPPAHSLLSSGINLYSQGKWQEAVLELRRAQVEAPSGELRGEILFWISLAELSAGEYTEALRDMDAMEEAAPESRRRKELPYHRGRALYYLGRHDEAIVLFNHYADTLVPGPEGVLTSADASKRAAALYWTGECLFSMGQLDKAGDVFRLIIEEYQRSPKYEASVYRLSLINQKKVEAELLGLLKWGHEESLRNMEEYRQRESAYDQALNAYQKRIAEMRDNSRFENLENSNARYKEQLELAEEKIRSLENSLREASTVPEEPQSAGAAERLETLKSSAIELENIIQDMNSRENGR